jgi:hypothetical protein
MKAQYRTTHTETSTVVLTRQHGTLTKHQIIAMKVVIGKNEI